MTRTRLPLLLALSLTGLSVACNNKDDTIHSGGVDSGDSTDSDNDGDPDSTDCAPDDPNISAYAQEICDGLDNDCDDAIDDADRQGADGKTTWYTDQDGDGYGTDDSASEACDEPYANSVHSGNDCDDGNDGINPAADEVCDELDNDCDGQIDVNAIDGDALYADVDDDGFGDPDSGSLLCGVPEGYTINNTDCDDLDPDINPDAEEICFNEQDDNCDDEVDESCPQEVCGDISTDTTWAYAPDGYYISCDMHVGGTAEPILTIEAGTKVYFALGVGLYVGDAETGSLVVEGGTSDDEAENVRFTSGVYLVDPTHGQQVGDWSGLVLGAYTDPDETDISGLRLYYGGAEHGVSAFKDVGGVVISGVDLEIVSSSFCNNAGAGVTIADGGNLAMSGSTLCDNDGYGLYTDDDSGLDGSSPSFENNTLAGNTDYPISVLARYAGELESTNDFSDHATGFEYIELRGDDLDSSMTVAAQDYSYLVTGDISIAGSSIPMLTLEDGVSLVFAEDVGLTIGTSRSAASISVEGATDGVSFSAANPVTGWSGITIQSGAATADFANCTVEHGGSNGYGALYLVNGASGLTSSVDDCTFSSSFSYGVYVGISAAPSLENSTLSNNAQGGLYVADTTSGEGELGDFTNNTFTGNTGYPVTLPASAMSALEGEFSTYGGNTKDYVYVTGSTVAESGTWAALDVPYYVSDDIFIKGSYKPVITVEGGATFLMSSSGIEVGKSSDGGLATEGTAANPVTFTSANTSSPTAGDWDGISFYEKTMSTSSTLEGLVVEYGGNNGFGGVYLSRAEPTFADCVISNNKNDGVYVTGTSSSVPEPSFTGCEILDNDDDGLYIAYNAGLTDFDSNTITGNGGYPVQLTAGYVSALDTGTTYAGNGSDMVHIHYDDVSANATWAALDVPYFIDYAISVKKSAALIVNVGTEVLFDSGGSFDIGSATAGSFTTKGTATSHVTFSSVESSPAAGDWSGITVGKYCSKVAMDYTDIYYANTNLSLNCATTMSVKNGDIKYSDTYDIYCGSLVGTVTWTGTDYDTQSGCSGL